MKAVFFEEHGGPEVLQYGDRPDPEPGPGEVRVAIRAAALNRLDVFVRNGIPDVPLPQIPGGDGAGIVERLGEGVPGLTPGDRVLIQPGLYCGTCEFCLGGEQSLCVRYRILGEHAAGTFAELVVVPSRNLFRVPEGMSFVRACAFPLAYQTAWRMIIGRARVRPGETVLDPRRRRGSRGSGARDRAPRGGAGDRHDVGRGEVGVAARGGRRAGRRLRARKTSGPSCGATPASAESTSSSTRPARRRG